MKRVWVLLLAVWPVWAAENGTLTLGEYLAQVRTESPQARSAIAAIQAAEGRLQEPEAMFSPEFYAEYRLFDNRAEPTSPFMAREVLGRNWKTGFRQQTAYGLSADLYFSAQRSTLLGVNPMFIPPQYQDFEQSSFGVTIKQSLLRDFLGDATRATLEAAKAMSRSEVLRRKFELKNILLQAENAYWSVVSYNEIVKLQLENVERAKRLSQHMSGRAKLRLYDDVDAMQAQAAFEQRQIELLTSQNARSALMRQFNTLRGRDSDVVENLSPLPKEQFLNQIDKKPGRKMSREDFQIIIEMAKASGEQARSAISKMRPQLDLVAGISANGLDPRSANSMQEALDYKNPNWNVGVVFSVPLDHWLLSDIRRGYHRQEASARDTKMQAEFSAERAWEDLIQQNQETQKIFERSLNLEKVQTDLAQREKRRMQNGRSTMLQTLTIEQNLALAQVSRVRAQLALLQVHNVIKQFEEQK